MPGDEKEFVYKRFKLDKLITSDKLFHKNSNPLLFLLCLVDSIEPIKQLRNNTLLNNVELNIDNTNIEIDLSHLPDQIRCRYLGKIQSLKTWLVDVEIIDDNCASIRLQ